jgi:hypothetical protein
MSEYEDFDQNNDGTVDPSLLDAPLPETGDNSDGVSYSDSSDSVQQALDIIDRLMEYTRSKFGIGSGGASGEAPSADASANFPVAPPSRLRAPDRAPVLPDDSEDEMARASGNMSMLDQMLQSVPGQNTDEQYTGNQPDASNAVADKAYETGDYGSLNEPVPRPTGPNLGSPTVEASDLSGLAGIPNDEEQQTAGKIAGAVGGKMRELGNGMGYLTNAPSRFLSYLQGAGSMPVQQFDNLKMQTGGTTDDERNLLAIAHAARQGGDEGGASALATTRQLYDHKMAFARAALNGNARKPGDVMAAVRAANQAFAHMPDGTMVRFQPGQGGVQAIVSSLSGAPIQSVGLSVPQFAKLLDNGAAGQFDNVYEKGIPSILQGLSSSERPQTTAGGYTGFTPEQQAAGNRGVRTISGRPPTQAMEPVDLRDKLAPKGREPDDLDNAMSRAYRLFPSASQQHERNNFVREQLAQAAKNKNELAEKRIEATRERTGVMGRNADLSAQVRTRAQDISSQNFQSREARLAAAMAAKLQQSGRATDVRLADRIIQMAGNPLFSADKFKQETGVDLNALVGKILSPQEQQQAVGGGNTGGGGDVSAKAKALGYTQFSPSRGVYRNPQTGKTIRAQDLQ